MWRLLVLAGLGGQSLLRWSGQLGGLHAIRSFLSGQPVSAHEAIPPDMYKACTQ